VTTDLLERHSTCAERAEDDRLSDVCAPLMHRSRKTGLFQYPAKADGGPTEEQQRAAIQALISGARDIAKNPKTIMSRRDYEATRAKMRTAVDALYALTNLDPFSLVAPTNQIETEIDELRRTVTVVERDRGELVERAVTVGIARLCRSIFGTVMLGVVAALASALLGTRIERYQVRNWLAAAA
jgi:hypothetical protein